MAAEQLTTTDWPSAEVDDHVLLTRHADSGKHPPGETAPLRVFVPPARQQVCDVADKTPRKQEKAKKLTPKEKKAKKKSKQAAKDGTGLVGAAAKRG